MTKHLKKFFLNNVGINRLANEARGVGGWEPSKFYNTKIPKLRIHKMAFTESSVSSLSICQTFLK